MTPEGGKRNTRDGQDGRAVSGARLKVGIPSHYAMGAGVLVSKWRHGFESHS